MLFSTDTSKLTRLVYQLHRTKTSTISPEGQTKGSNNKGHFCNITLSLHYTRSRHLPTSYSLPRQQVLPQLKREKIASGLVKQIC